MSGRAILIVLVFGLGAGLLFGVLAGGFLARPQVTVSASAVELASPDQDDYVIMVAEAYSNDLNLNLARDRLARLSANDIATRVESLATSYAPQRDLAASYLARLAVALGSNNPPLVALAAPPTSTSTPTETATNTPTNTPTSTPTPTLTPTVVPSRTPTAVPTRRPPTLAPTALPPTAVPAIVAAPAPPTAFEPGDLGRWPGSFHFEPAAVVPGQGYWHLTKATYCDAYNSSQPGRNDYSCEDLPGGPTGTNIYVMTGGAPIHVIREDGTDVSNNPTIIGDKKSPNDMCNCTYSFESAPFRISVAGAPSDAVSGFCLCSVNFGWGSHAHVRYFLYFEYINR